jgi:hypothetical protein
MAEADGEPLLTLEPLIDAVRAGVEQAGWLLSGLQKTTSHEFEGRWEGASTRSAYLFFHSAAAADYASVEAYLDETSRGLAGNLALVVGLAPLGQLGDAGRVLGGLRALSKAALPGDKKTPVTLRLRLDDTTIRPEAAEAEVRFKLRLPRGTMARGGSAVRTLATTTVRAFESILAHPGLGALVGEV